MFFPDNVDMAKVMIGLRVTEDVEKAIEVLSKEQARTKANMAEYMIIAWLREHRPELLSANDEK